MKTNSVFLSSREETDDELKPLPPPPSDTETKSLFNRLPLTNRPVPRARYRNFSHISEFGSGLEAITKSHKKKDKIGEFLEKKRERNTSKRLFGRKQFWSNKILLFVVLRVNFVTRNIKEKKCGLFWTDVLCHQNPPSQHHLIYIEKYCSLLVCS